MGALYGEDLACIHAADVDADTLIRDSLQKVAAALPAGGMLVFDMIETGEPSLAAAPSSVHG